MLPEEESLSKKLLAISELLLKQAPGNSGYQPLSDALLSLSGAKYALVVAIDDSGEKARVIAFSGPSEFMHKVTEILGFSLINKEWKISHWTPVDRAKGNLVAYDGLYEISAGEVSKKSAALLHATLNLGKIYALAVTNADEIVIGDIVLCMAADEVPANKEALELSARQFGLHLMRLRAEQALLKERNEKIAILDNLVEQVIYLDPDFKIVWANQTAADVHNMEPHEYLGKRCFEVWHGLNSPCNHCLVETVVKEKQTQIGETKSPDGRIWMTTISPIFDQDGVLTGFLDTALDITDIKKAEEDMKKLNTALEQRVKDRTAELEVLIKELNAFTYSVSHDLRAPLRSIEGFSRALWEDCGHLLNDEGNNYIQRVISASERMSELIEDLLKLSKVARHGLQNGKVDLSAMFATITAELQLQDPQREMTVQIAPNLSASGDRSLLRIALENLLDNAWKFTALVPQPRIEFGADVKNGETVYYVKDNGAGFDIKYASKMFDPFQRLHSIHDYPGTGIGLSIVARVIRRHGGEIWADSEEGNGATFYFTLPS